MESSNQKVLEYNKKMKTLRKILEKNDINSAIQYYSSNWKTFDGEDLKFKLFVMFYDDPSAFNISKNIYTNIMKNKAIKHHTKEILTFYMSIKGLFIGNDNYFLNKGDYLKNSCYINHYELIKARHLIYSKKYDKAHSILDNLYLREKRDEYLSILSIVFMAKKDFSEAKRCLEKVQDKNSIHYWQYLLNLSLRIDDFENAFNYSTHILKNFNDKEFITPLFRINYNLSSKLEKDYLFKNLCPVKKLEEQNSLDAKIHHILKHESGKSQSIFAKDYKIEENLERLLDKSKKIEPFNLSFYDTYLFDEGKTIGTVSGIETSKILVVTEVNSSTLDNIITAYPAVSFYNASRNLERHAKSLKEKIKVI